MDEFFRHIPEESGSGSSRKALAVFTSELCRYDAMLQTRLRMFFSGWKPGDEACVEAMETIARNLVRLRRRLQDPSEICLLQMKAQGIRPEEIAQKLGMTLEEIYRMEKRNCEVLRETRARYHIHRENIRDYYMADTYSKILTEIQASTAGERIILPYDQVLALADQWEIPEEFRQDLADYLIRHGCIILAPDGELRRIPEKRRCRDFRTEESRLRYYSSLGDWVVRTHAVICWYEKSARDEKDALHKTRFMTHLQRDKILAQVYAMRQQGFTTQQMARELEKDPEELVAAEERIWHLYKASFPV